MSWLPSWAGLQPGCHLSSANYNRLHKRSPACAHKAQFFWNALHNDGTNITGHDQSHIYIKYPASSVLSIGRHLTYAFKRGLLFWRQTPCQVVCKKKMNAAFVSYLTKFIRSGPEKHHFNPTFFHLKRCICQRKDLKGGLGYIGDYIRRLILKQENHQLAIFDSMSAPWIDSRLSS